MLKMCNVKKVNRDHFDFMVTLKSMFQSTVILWKRTSMQPWKDTRNPHVWDHLKHSLAETFDHGGVEGTEL